jgi:hypothetical protein
VSKKFHNCDQKIILLHDNCRVHKARQVREDDESGFVEMEHPSYSPDLAPSDYYLRRRFSSDEYLNTWWWNFSKICQKNFFEGIALLEKLWNNR